VKDVLSFLLGFGEIWHMFQGYVGKIIDSNTTHELTNLDAPHALKKGQSCLTVFLVGGLNPIEQ